MPFLLLMEKKDLAKIVDEAEEEGTLMPESGLVRELMMCPGRTTQELQTVLVGQASLARSRGKFGWLRDVSKEANVLQLCSKAWIRANISSKSFVEVEEVALPKCSYEGLGRACSSVKSRKGRCKGTGSSCLSEVQLRGTGQGL